MIKSSIDIGSNSVLLLTAEVKNHSIVREIYNESSICSLGKDLDKNKEFHPESTDSAFIALSHYRKLLDAISFPADKVIVTATEASRVAKNAPEFFKKVKQHLGFDVQIITSSAEAFYTAKGVCSSLSATRVSDDNLNKNLVIMDIGGASTELIKILPNPFEVISSISLPFGSVRAFNWNEEGVLKEKTKNTLDQFSTLSDYKTDTLICVAGSMTALTAMYLKLPTYQEQKVDGIEIPIAHFNSFASTLQSSTPDQIKNAFPYLEKRAAFLSAGSYLAQTLCNHLEVKTLKISTRGLRYGVLDIDQLRKEDLFKK